MRKTREGCHKQAHLCTTDMPVAAKLKTPLTGSLGPKELFTYIEAYVSTRFCFTRGIAINRVLDSFKQSILQLNHSCCFPNTYLRHSPHQKGIHRQFLFLPPYISTISITTSSQMSV